MTQEPETQVEDKLGDDSEEIIPFKYSIISYGADYPVDGLVKRIKDGSILIPPFQRGFVWNFKQASRFIESLLLDLPVPGIFLSKEQKTQKLLVIDGQQRLRTLQYFYGSTFKPGTPEKVVFALKGVHEKFEGVEYTSLNDEDRRRLDDSILHATVVKQDEPSNDESSIYQIFERLNTGGSLLQPQEIRACIFHGKFNDLLKQLNRNESWRSVYSNVSSRMKDQELILRFLALYFNAESYKRPMKEFLNSYMGKNRDFEFETDEQIKKIFVDTIEVVNKYLGSNAFKPERSLNAAVFDAVMVGLAHRIAKGKIENYKALRKQHQALLKDSEFINAIKTGTADEIKVSRRIQLATKAFADLK